ncbi:hypothetical protein P378_03240 [Desulforamulus profundi]|uniref:Permease n=1 Tax=Desulforamulus profundi TaxID=1383067 RepID=A0A2C6MIX4_9FIRM|nr:hypothetical protein P378_03240 [Desulforamulus profundi]
MFTIMLIVGISLALLSPETISEIMGAKSGWAGMPAGLAIGSVTLIPPFVAFPLAAALLKAGAGYPQIAAFVSTVMAVGVVTLPAEIKYLDKRTAILRNGLFFLVATLFSLIIGQVM